VSSTSESEDEVSGSEPLSGRERIEKLQEVMDWGEYEAAAYEALVQEGPLEANDLVYRTDIPQGRIYDTLNGLGESAVKKQGRNPTRYDAQHPRKLIKGKQEEFNDSASRLKNQLEQAYDVEQDRRETRHPAWVMTGLPGTAQCMEELIEDAEKRVLIVDRDLRWIQTETVETLADLVAADVTVQIVGWHTRREKLEELAMGGVPVHSHENIDSSFCIVDDKNVVFRVGRGNTGVAVRDEPMATILTREAQRQAENASVVTADE
jgi:sugar-specific transcriptional regulator TrmB